MNDGWKEEAFREFRAQQIFDLLCRTLDCSGIPYRTEEGRCVLISVRGDAGGDAFVILTVDAGTETLVFLSPLETEVPEEKLAETAAAVNRINDRIVCGGFEIDAAARRAVFRYACSTVGLMPGGEWFIRILTVACQCVDDYGPALNRLIAGELSLHDFARALPED